MRRWSVLLLVCGAAVAVAQKYEPTDESLKTHPVPQWYNDAKFGIFIHWGVFSYPGWAELSGNFHDVSEEYGWPYWFEHNSYAEWYENTAKIDGSPAQKHHAATYGAGFPYEGFKELFRDATQQWNPRSWAALFKRAGARYVVLTTKHHDGFLMWPSNVANPNRADWTSKRDLVGELTDAVNAEGLTMGLYYSGGYDWTWKNVTISTSLDLARAVPQSAEYARYNDEHWRELMARYKPKILWNDITSPAALDVRQLFADAYNTDEDIVVNNRFNTASPTFHYDFSTPEYATYDDIVEKKWESTRGMGYSFGYNRNDIEDIYLSAREIATSLVDIVSKNGNLLLNVGPTATGEIPPMQLERLEAVGAWLDVVGPSIYGTRTWTVPQAVSVEESIAVRFTATDSSLFASLLSRPVASMVVTIPGVVLSTTAPSSARLLGFDGSIQLESVAGQAGIRLHFPNATRELFTYAFQISPLPAHGAARA